MKRRFTMCIALAANLLVAGCAHGPDALYGSYIAHGTGYEDLTPSVTLVLSRPNRYRFCRGGRCANGKFSVRPVPIVADGRINFDGPSIEEFSLSLYRGTFGESDILNQRGKQNSIELDYRIGMGTTEITLGAGDAAFVKR